MTIDEFVEVFREHVRLRGEEWIITLSGAIRDEKDWYCPLARVANLTLDDRVSYYKAANVLEIGHYDAWEIMIAADNFGDTPLRAKLLEAANLKEEKE